MSRFPTSFLMTLAAAIFAGVFGRVLAEEKPPGLVSTQAVVKGSGLTQIAVRSPTEILLGTTRGEIWEWNPKAASLKKLRPASSPAAPISNLHCEPNNRLIAGSGSRLEIRPQQGEPRQIELPPLTQVAISPTTAQIAGVGKEPPISFFDPETGMQTHRVDRQVHVDDMRYSPSGKFLATSRYVGLYFWNSKTGGLVWKSRLEDNIRGFVFSPDQSVIFVSLEREGLWVIDAASGKILHRYARTHDFVKEDFSHPMAISPDGTLLAVAPSPERIEIWETFTGRTVLSLAIKPGEIADVQFLPSGVHLVSADGRGWVTLWDLTAPEFATPFQPNAPYTNEQFRELWRMLGEHQAGAAWTAMIALRHRPEQALDLIDNPPNEELLIRQLIGRLDDDQFTAREAAYRALRQLSLNAEPFLQKTLSKSRSAEVRVRIRRLLGHLAGPNREAQLRLLRESKNHRQMRVVQLLKWLGTPAAKKRLELFRDSTNVPAIRKFAAEAIHRLSPPPIREPGP